MAAKRLSKRKIRGVLRLKHEHSITNRIKARICSVGRFTVAEYLRRAEEAGLSRPLPQKIETAIAFKTPNKHQPSPKPRPEGVEANAILMADETTGFPYEEASRFKSSSLLNLFLRSNAYREAIPSDTEGSAERCEV